VLFLFAMLFFSFFVGSVQEEDDVLFCFSLSLTRRQSSVLGGKLRLASRKVLYSHIIYGWVRPVRYRSALVPANLANSSQKPPSASLATGGVRRRKRWPPVGATDRSGGHQWEPDQ